MFHYLLQFKCILNKTLKNIIINECISHVNNLSKESEHLKCFSNTCNIVFSSSGLRTLEANTKKPKKNILISGIKI